MKSFADSVSTMFSRPEDTLELKLLAPVTTSDVPLA